MLLLYLSSRDSDNFFNCGFQNCQTPSQAADANSDGILDFHVLTGNDDIYLAPIVSPALPTELRSIFEQGYVQAIHDESSYEALLRKYFGAVVNRCVLK